MADAEANLVITESNRQSDGIAATSRVAPQPMMEVVLESGDDWQFYYLDTVLDGERDNTAIHGGPLAMMVVEDNDVIMDFGMNPEDSEGLSDRVYAVGNVGSIPIYVAMIAYKSATPGSAGTVRFYAPYNKDYLQSL